MPHNLRPSVLVGNEEEKDQDDDGNGPSGIPRKTHGFVISEKNEGELVMLQPIPLFEVLISRIGYRDPVIASYHPPRIPFHRLLVLYDQTSPCG